MTTDIPVAVEINCETGEVTERFLTPEEMQQREAAAIEWANEEAIRQADEAAKQALKASAKAKLVAGEPLTEEEASIITL